jgi:hypothetical protein
LLNKIDLTTLNLFVFGYVDYVDKFGARHRSGYARLHDIRIDDPGHWDGGKVPEKRNNLPFVTKPGYNYDIEIDENGQPKTQGTRKGWRYYTGLSRP